SRTGRHPRSNRDTQSTAQHGGRRAAPQAHFVPLARSRWIRDQIETIVERCGRPIAFADLEEVVLNGAEILDDNLLMTGRVLLLRHRATMLAPLSPTLGFHRAVP